MNEALSPPPLPFSAEEALFSSMSGRVCAVTLTFRGNFTPMQWNRQSVCGVLEKLTFSFIFFYFCADTHHLYASQVENNC